MEPVSGRKIPTRDGSLWAELTPTPKILPKLRSWYPHAWIVGWKYEMDGDRADAVARGRDQLRSCATDGCVVNGLAYGPGFGFVSSTESDIAGCAHCPDEDALFGLLGSFPRRPRRSA